MNFPTDTELEQNIRSFLQRIPRRKTDFTDPGAAGRTGYPYVQDTGRGMSLDSGEFSAPPVVSPPISSPPQVGGGVSGHYSFQIADASAKFGGDPYVQVYDGLVNDELPEGMGSDDYFLPATDGMTIYVGITYDTDTFEITSRYLNTGDPPDAQIGFFTVILGGASVTTDNSASPPTVAVKPFNAHCGDIKFDLLYKVRDGDLYIQPFSMTGDEVLISQ